MSTPPVPRKFRRHDLTDVEHFPGSTGILGQLIVDWARLCSLPSTARTLRRWTQTEPALAGADALGSLVDRIDAADHDATDQMLLALIRLTLAGQQLAGRVVLQCMLPKITRMAGSVPVSDHDSLETCRQLAVGAFWEVLATYPVDRRPAQVAANLALDTLRHLHPRSGRLSEVLVDPLELADHEHDLLGLHRIDPPESAPPAVGGRGGLAGDAELLDVLHWGMQVRAISRDEAQLLARVYLQPATGRRNGAATAAQLDLSHVALRKRVARARQKLIQAVRDEAEGAHDVTEHAYGDPAAAILSVDGAADLLGTDPDALTEQVRAGRLRVRRADGTWWTTRRWVSDYQHTAPPGALA